MHIAVEAIRCLGREGLQIMRDPAIVEEDLMEIASIADDLTKFERIVTWCATHPDEVPFAMRILMNRSNTTQA